ncbi:GNAT family N-acetyltransferase [Catenulispora rubra]|uniref:GNAT family N-acetyltransferase n=1 Tax=Catenulispora rubra TaxID=280293 RepID=UPI00189244F9|nr:GNAT family N-acetyltransferase [Catenulispora rubra]
MTIVIRRADLPAEAGEITKLLVDYMTTALRELHETFGVEDSPTDVSGLRDSLEKYRDASKALFVAQDMAQDAAGRLVGVAGLRTLEPGVVEVKRMYVVPECRGRHVGSQLLDRLLEEAQRMQARTVRLDTVRFMADAQRLYRSRGFVERTPYAGTEIPPHLQQYWIFFERNQAVS